MPELNYNPIEVAIVTLSILVSVIAIAVARHNLCKPKKYIPAAYWTAKEYYMHLNACIITCSTMDELLDLHKPIKTFTAKDFADRVSMRRRKKLQQDLIDTYNLKAQSLEEQKEVLCKS